MPPWPPSADGDRCEKLQHARKLSAAERDIIARWVAGGTPEGDPSKGDGTPPARAELVFEPAVVGQSPGAWVKVR